MLPIRHEWKAVYFDLRLCTSHAVSLCSSWQHSRPSLTSTALSTSISSAIAKLCPTVTDSKNMTRCKEGTVLCRHSRHRTLSPIANQISLVLPEVTPKAIRALTNPNAKFTLIRYVWFMLTGEYRRYIRIPLITA